MTGYASKKSETVSMAEAITEIARVRFGGDKEAAFADIEPLLIEGSRWAYQRRGSHKRIESLSWQKCMSVSIDRSTIYLRYNKISDIYFYRSHLQELYDHTLWEDSSETEKGPSAGKQASTRKKRNDYKSAGEKADLLASTKGVDVTKMSDRELAERVRRLMRTDKDIPNETIPGDRKMREFLGKWKENRLDSRRAE